MGRDAEMALRLGGIALSVLSLATAVRRKSSGSSSSEVYALARAVRSEVDGFPRDVQRAAAWAVRNRAKARHTTIRALLRGSRKAWGRQRGGDPPFSSRLPPKPAHLVIAREVLRQPAGADPTRGATSFLEPALYERQYAAGEVRRSLDELRAKWRADGGELLFTLGPLEFWT